MLRLFCVLYAILLANNIVEGSRWWELAEQSARNRDKCIAEQFRCENDEMFSATVKRDYNLEDLTMYRRFIMDRHSYYRDLIAGGHIPGYEPAVRMNAVLEWREELEVMSELQCETITDWIPPYFATHMADQVSINIYDDEGGVEYSIEEIIRDALMTWFDEYEKCDMSEIRNYTGKLDLECERFLNLMLDRTNAMGCTLHTQLNAAKRNSIFTCVYSGSKNKAITNEKIYREGEASSWCRTRHPIFRGLCIGEEFDHWDRSWYAEPNPPYWGPIGDIVYSSDADAGSPCCRANFGVLLVALILSLLCYTR